MIIEPLAFRRVQLFRICRLNQYYKVAVTRPYQKFMQHSQYTNSSDEELMLHICNGETGAFDELYKRYGKRLFAYFSRMLNYNKELAEDALQDVFLKIAETPERFDGSRCFKTWIFSVASNSCKNYYRHQTVVAGSKDELKYIEENRYDNEFVKTASRLDGAEFKKMLDEALNELSPEKKEAFILRYQEDKSISEIAFIQDCPEGSVKSRLHYTIKSLEEKLKIFNPIS
jgi:RNA polymerase sigma-70 factor (ECF subfamily)